LPAVSEVNFLLLESPAHLAGQFVEEISHGAVIEIAGVLRKNLAGEYGDRLAMTCGPAFGIGVEDFSAGEHTGQKRLASRGALRHPAVRCPYGLFQVVDTPRRPIAGSEPERDLEFAPRPFRCRKDFIIGTCSVVQRQCGWSRQARSFTNARLR